MKILHKAIDVFIKDYESLVLVVLSINGIQLSRMKCVLQDDNSLLISDIEPYRKKKYYGKGYGSKIMKELLIYAEENEIHTIYGYLSLVDRKHEDRLHHFYEKHGFKIELFDEPTDMFYGRVEKRL